MFTGIFIVLFWSYNRLGDYEGDQKVKIREKDDNRFVENVNFKADNIDVAYQKSMIGTDTLNPDQEVHVEEIQYDYQTDQGGVLGTIEFPSLARKISILQGTDENQLSKGAGHYEKSAKPGENDHCVLVGYHESAFHGIETLLSGDLMIIKTSSGVFTYQVTGYQSTSLSKSIAIHQSDFAKLTLTTAHPDATMLSKFSRHTIFATMTTSVLN